VGAEVPRRTHDQTPIDPRETPGPEPHQRQDWRSGPASPSRALPRLVVAGP
jgi:hypothetical protein